MYFLFQKKQQREVVVEITPLQPPSTDSPMSVCESDDLMDVTPHIQEDYMELYELQTTLT